MLNEFTELTPLRRLFVVLVALVCLAAVLHFIVSETYLPVDVRGGENWGWDFRNNLWSPAYLLLQGKSPYRIDQLYDANSVWLPMAIGLFLPFGLLSLAIAKNIWFVLSGAALVVILALSIRVSKPNPLLLALCLVGLLIFPPLVSHMLVGQFSLMTVLLALLAAELLARGYAPGWMALPVALALSKPQLAVLLLPGLLVGCYRRGGWREVAIFLAAVAGWSLLLSLPLWIGFPGWIDGFIWALTRNAAWIQPSTLEVLRTTLINAGVAGWETIALILWGILFALALFLTGWLWRKLPAHQAMMWTLALTILVTPYVWTWDFVLMLPLLVHTLFNHTSRIARAVWIFGFALTLGLVLQVRIASTEVISDEKFWWIPWGLLAVVLATLAANRAFPPRPEAEKSKDEGE
jgi:hypothetical protein